MVIFVKNAKNGGFPGLLVVFYAVLCLILTCFLAKSPVFRGF